MSVLLRSLGWYNYMEVSSSSKPFGTDHAVISIMSAPWVNLTRHMAVSASSQPVSLPSLLLLIISIKEGTGKGLQRVKWCNSTWLRSLKMRTLVWCWMAKIGCEKRVGGKDKEKKLVSNEFIQLVCLFQFILSDFWILARTTNTCIFVIK